MLGAPGEVSAAQLRELNIRLAPSKAPPTEER